MAADCTGNVSLKQLQRQFSWRCLVEHVKVLGSALCKTVKAGTADLAGRCKSAAAPFCIFRRDLEPRPREVPL